MDTDKALVCNAGISHRSDGLERRKVLVAVVAVVVTAALGCIAPADLGDQTIESEGASEAPLFAATTGDASSCSAFANAQTDRADFYLQAIMNSNAFFTCMNARLAGTSGSLPYNPSCASSSGTDPSGATDPAIQIANIRQVLYAGNHFAPNCSSPGTGGSCGGASAFTTTGGTGDTWNSQNTSDAVTYCDDWLQGFGDWATWYAPPNPGSTPWNFRSADIIHEFLHEHTYHHNGSCGNNSANSIVDGCVANIIEQSQCAGSGNNLDYCTDPEAVNLPGSWDTANDRPDQNPANCVCVRGLRHRIGLRAYNGTSFVRAINGGAGSVDAQAIGFGSWETTHVIDLNLMQGRYLDGDMFNLDYVQFRAPNGNLWRAHDGVLSADCTAATSPGRANINTDLSTRPSDPCTFQIRKVSGPGGYYIRNDSVISIQAYDGRYVSANNGGGSSMTADRTVVGAWETFTVQQPRRAWFVSIQSLNGSSRFLSRSADGSLTANATTQTDAAAFWIVDHNGDVLRHNDVVSFESDDSLGSFVQTCTNGTGQVRADAATMRTCSKFMIKRWAGAGQVQANEIVYFQSMQEGRYLTAEPPAYGGLVYNNATVVNSWEKFALVLYAPTAAGARGPWTVD